MANIYVDQPRKVASRFLAGMWCHLWSDDPGELAKFRNRLQRMGAVKHPGARVPHYDLTPARRLEALALGAIPIEYKEYLREVKNAGNGGHADDGVQRRHTELPLSEFNKLYAGEFNYGPSPVDKLTGRRGGGDGLDPYQNSYDEAGWSVPHLPDEGRELRHYPRR